MISVIICTYSPRRDFLDRTLAALRAQLLPAAEWELVVVDNNSPEPLAGWLSLAWHPHGRIVREEKQGLTPSRLRGIAESGGDIVVFVDDDTVLDPDYLQQVARIAKDHPRIGVWGGQTRGEFESPLPPDMEPFLGYLTISPLTGDCWSNSFDCPESLPFGAGICLRRDVADAYAKLVTSDPRRMGLDRQGKTLSGCGDHDMAYTGIGLGYGMGRFAGLRMIHLIPTQRLTWEYLEKAAIGGDSSTVVLHYLLGRSIRRYTPRRERIKFWLDYWATSPGHRRLMLAKEKGRRLGLEMVRKLEAGA